MYESRSLTKFETKIRSVDKDPIFIKDKVVVYLTSSHLND